ncbi:MAG: hypothetical protein NT015_01185 [Alphaproteobacteria bacterium]|nr:hypothetical protein [Alphaproteobacteria bacterium]
MIRAIFVMVVVVTSCVSVQPTEYRDGIAQSCNLQWGAEPEGLRDGPFSHRRVCNCAAESVTTAWSESRVAAFDRRFASYARDFRTYADSITPEMIRERGPEGISNGFPEPSPALRRDLGEYGTRLDLCVRLGRPASDAEILDYEAEMARLSEQWTPQ